MKRLFSVYSLYIKSTYKNETCKDLILTCKYRWIIHLNVPESTISLQVDQNTS